jgi:hypothetical protein
MENEPIGVLSQVRPLPLAALADKKPVIRLLGGPLQCNRRCLTSLVEQGGDNYLLVAQVPLFAAMPSSRKMRGKKSNVEAFCLICSFSFLHITLLYVELSVLLSSLFHLS